MMLGKRVFGPSVALAASIALATTAAGAPTASDASTRAFLPEDSSDIAELARSSAANSSSGISPSFNVTTCPGYSLVGQPQNGSSGFTANLTLAGDACNAFGVDIQNLTLAVTYETDAQLHVHIYDTAKNQFQLPNGLLFDRPEDDINLEGGSTADDSHLEFHYTNSTPWAFWITRKSDGDVLFDTRSENIPTYDTPLLNSTLESTQNSTTMPAHPLVFENQYLQLSSALPVNANIYGLGEYISGGFRRNPNATIQPFFTLDSGDPVDSNDYGYHPVYMEARTNGSNTSTHVVSYLNTAGMDIILRPGVIQYRAIGGTLDFRFFSGDGNASSTDSNSSNSTQSGNSSASINSPLNAIAQYVSFINVPTMPPLWSLGFHLCRWGYATANETLEAAKAMRAADIPQEVQWNDIDYMDLFQDWTYAPDNFSTSDLNSLISYLSDNNQHYIPIVDAAIKAVAPGVDYSPATVGIEQDVFLKSPNGSVQVSQVWPGYTYFPAWNANNTQQWWTDSVRNFSQLVNFSGLWLDMNEPSSFCVGSCGYGANFSVNMDYAVPTTVSGWPEGYDNNTYGNSGNITVNGTLTHNGSTSSTASRRSFAELNEITELTSRASNSSSNATYSWFYDPYQLPAYSYDNDTQRYVDVPPYAIHNGIYYSPGPIGYNLNKKTAPMEALDSNYEFYDVHNLFGSLEEKTTYNALIDIRPDERPFLISRSTYPGAQKYTHHWLGDNYSLWSYMWRSMQGLLQFQLFGIPMVGADTCGFNQNSDEELCLRWQQMAAAASPFYRNHNTISALAQEPYRWDSVANATRTVNYKRLELLPYYYSVMARASQNGTPVVRALWYDFPSTFSDTFESSSQVLFDPNLLVTPVFTPNATTVQGYFPSAGGSWRNIYTYEALNVTANTNTTIAAPLQTNNVHLRPGSALLTFAEPKYTTTETANGTYGLLVNLADDGSATGDAYIDDGISPWPTNSCDVLFQATNGTLTSSYSAGTNGTYTIPRTLSSVVVLGVTDKPTTVTTQGNNVTTTSFQYDAGLQLLNVTGLTGNLNAAWNLTWS